MKALTTTIALLLIAIILTTDERKKKKNNGGHEIATIMATYKTPNTSTKPITVCVPTFASLLIPEDKQFNAFGFHAGIKTWR